MTTRTRLLQGISALGLVLALSACGGSPAADAIAEYDPAEVEMLRKQGEKSGLQVTDDLLLATLQTRGDCRVIKAALDSMAKGETSGPAIAEFQQLPRVNKKRGQQEQAEYFQIMVDKAKLGDSREAQEYHSANCASVK